DIAVGYWRDDAFKEFAIGTRQISIVDGLGEHQLYRRVSIEVQVVAAGGRIEYPACHAFPMSLQVVRLAPDFANAEGVPAGNLALKATYAGPCSASGIDATGKHIRLYQAAGPQAYVFVGSVGSGDPLGAVYVLHGLGDCTQAVVKATCA
ncbi:MAG: hypothetical protein JOY80_01850, partial [Candidatus Dormibacteraeota bacterium]|nr:hypothetical protein [Candidatus Dormibacteraeota bacterium]